MSLGTALVKEWKTELPWQFRNQENIDAIITAIGEQLTELETVNEQLIDLVDVDTATGKNLDMVGEIVGISRIDAYSLLELVRLQDMTDETYRSVLKFQILKNNADGTYEDIMKGLHLLWGDDTIMSYEENPEIDVYNSQEWNAPDPATVKITIEDISTDDVDPDKLKPMVIRAGGVKLYFDQTYRDSMELIDWEHFTNLTMARTANKQYNGLFQYDGAENYGDDTLDQYQDIYYNYYKGEFQYNGVEQYGPGTGWGTADTVDAIILNQAKKKLLRHRMASEGNSGESLKIMYFCWGTGTDDNGDVYEPTGAETALVNEIYRCEYSYYTQTDEATVTYCGIIPEDECDNEYITEMALADEDGDLICIKTFEAKQKPEGNQMVFKIDDVVDLVDE